MAKIFHIVDRSFWESAKKAGSYHPESLDNEGFIHLSKTDQLLKVANSFYKGEKNLIILRVIEDKIQPKLVYEPPLEAPLSEVLFPHVYGELNIDSVEAEIDFPPGEDGRFTLPVDLL